MELQKINEALNTYIRPQTFPVAVKMVSSASELPQKARMPKRDLGMDMPLCQGMALARRYGWTMAMGKDDMLCPLGAIALGLVPAKDKFLNGDFNIPFWVKNQDIRAKMVQALPRLEQGKYTFLVAAPLNRADFEPQVIIVYGNPAQLSILIQSTVYATGEPVMSGNTGAFACGGEITMPILTDQCQLVMAGGGDRTVAQTQDHEAAFAIPAGKVEALVEGLEQIHKAGMRYPTPSFLTYQSVFPRDFGELMNYSSQ